MQAAHTNCLAGQPAAATTGTAFLDPHTVLMKLGNPVSLPLSTCMLHHSFACAAHINFRVLLKCKWW